MHETILMTVMLGTAAFIAQPFWRRRAASSANGNRQLLSELLEKRDNLLTQIKEVEFDHEVGKISAEDFAEINASYRAEAISVLRRIDMQRGNKAARKRLEAELQTLRAGNHNGRRACSHCGRTIQTSDRYCSNCGRKSENSEV